jgi:two-component system invasion response regulator UvrY
MGANARGHHEILEEERADIARLVVPPHQRVDEHDRFAHVHREALSSVRVLIAVLCRRRMLPQIRPGRRTARIGLHRLRRWPTIGERFEPMSAAQTKVMLVDDHSVVRMGFRLLLEGSSDIQVVAEAESGEDAIRRFDEARPDVVVMDISMPGIGGLEAIRRILAREPAARILVLSAHEDAMHARRVLEAGAAGYLTKRSAAEALMQAIRQVGHGKTFLEPEIAQELAIRQLSGGRDPVDTLSEKEFKVFLALAEGQSVQAIAEVMSLSPRTVGTHLYNIKQKLGASNSAELALIAVRAGLLTP